MNPGEVAGRIGRSVAWLGAVAIVIACGGELDRASGGSTASPSPGSPEGVQARSPASISMERGSPTGTETKGADRQPADGFEIVSHLWVELDGDAARVKFTIELENATSNVVSPTFLKIEQQNWVAQGGEKRGVGGGTIGIRRPLELAPGERAFMHRGDFTTLGAAEFLRGEYAGAGFSGAVTLQDESGATFQRPFDHAVKFSTDENGHPMTETWRDPPGGEPLPPPTF